MESAVAILYQILAWLLILCGALMSCAACAFASVWLNGLKAVKNMHAAIAQLPVHERENLERHMAQRLGNYPGSPRNWAITSAIVAGLFVAAGVAMISL
jgi:hypothetical protein